MDDLVKLLEQHQLLGGGLFLMLSGSVLYYLKGIPSSIIQFLKRNFVVSIEIRERDESFNWMRIWFNQHARNIRNVVVGTQFNDDDNEYCEEDGPKSEIEKYAIHFSPAPGIHFMKLPTGKWVKIDRSKEETPQNSGNGGKFPSDIITISAFGRNVDALKKIVFDAKELAIPNDDKIEVRINGGYNNWILLDRVVPRKIDSVILPAELKTEVMNDVGAFLKGKQWYESLGIPYQRGYCFYGPPGTGKTSWVKAIATHFHLNIYVLNLNNTKIDDADLNLAIQRISQNSVLLIEDIDCLKIKRDNSKDIQSSNISFSGLLNALDGVGSKPGRLLFVTTNCIDNLDPALLRCGRIDLVREIGYANAEQILELYQRFYSLDLDYDVAVNVEGKVSMAYLQDVFLRNKNAPNGAVMELINFQNSKELVEV